MKKRFAILVLTCVWAVCGVQAQSMADEVNDFLTAINTPDVSLRAARDIRTHMADIRNALASAGADASFYRENQVVKVVIPISDLFEANEADLRSSATRSLDIYSSVIGLPTMYRLVVGVFSDDTGDDVYKADLTSRRADVLLDFFDGLRGNGKDMNVLAFGLADNLPVVANDNIAHRAANRRVEVYIVPEWQMIEMSKSGRLKRD